MDLSLVESDVLRSKVESTMHMGEAYPEAHVSKLFMKNASFSTLGTSLALGSVQGNLGVPAEAEHLHRLFGPCGGGARQDVLVFADLDASLEEENDFEALAAHSKQKRKVGKSGGTIASRREEKVRSKGAVSL